MNYDSHHAMLSALAYKNLTPILEASFKKIGYKTVDFLNIDGAQAYLLANKDLITVVFRGTEPSQPSDIIADLKTWKNKSDVAGRVHSGFYDEIEKLWPKIEEFVAKHEGKECTITGHSLGAAMATICAARLQDKFENMCLYTYGSPRVGNKEFISSLKFKHCRWVNNNDTVTRVPPALFGFRHYGKMHYLNHYGNVRNGLSTWQRIKDRFRGRLSAWKKLQFFDGVFDHSVSDYHSKLDKSFKVSNKVHPKIKFLNS